MKNLLLALATFAASPALAHPGAHVHPHAESAVPVLLGIAVIAVAAVLLWRAR